MSDEEALQPATTPATWPDLVQRIRQRTPARVLVERAGAAYSTATQLGLRRDHAAARDAVRNELDMTRDLGEQLVAEWKLFEVSTLAQDKDDYLLRPDRGRRLDESARQLVEMRCAPGCDLQLVIGDGLSVTAVAAQAPQLLPMIAAQSLARGWKLGQPFVVRYCRVGVMNEIGELLAPGVVVLLIGERPGLATAESLSAYMAYRPRPGDTDADRNLISNIHVRGVPPPVAAARIVSLAAQMMERQISGVSLKEQLL
ncbi:MAG TPA: ethanolamine ammonia-lyase subunit EutC [Candidatus Saccharimonadales bacterium]|jgi:ethanolamine ammonia-lyase small subunit|nr:ethanolamine ammonia-lyase subunit EutC [Candidatus Saccharimonadales bacterium]